MLLPFEDPEQPIVVAMSDTSHSTLNIGTVNSMSICGRVTPVMNAIVFVHIKCLVYDKHRYVYVYQELSSFVHLYELEVLSMLNCRDH